MAKKEYTTPNLTKIDMPVNSPLRGSRSLSTPMYSIKPERQRRSFNSNFFVRVLCIVFCVLALATIIRMTQDSTKIPTFTSFLELLTNVPDVSIPFQEFSSVTLGDWGIFNFLREFVSILLNIVNVLVFLFNGIANVCIYVAYFFRWLFVF